VRRIDRLAIAACSAAAILVVSLFGWLAVNDDPAGRLGGYGEQWWGSVPPSGDMRAVPRADAAVVCTPLGSLTPNLSLCKPLSGERSWDAAMNNNFTVLDALFAGNTVTATGQTAAIGTATLLVPPSAGLYSVRYYVVVTSTGSSTNLVLNVLATDDAAARTHAASTVSCAATNFTQGAFTVRAASGNIQYNTTMTGTCTYAVYLIARLI
jgi:hypothetical protein